MSAAVTKYLTVNEVAEVTRKHPVTIRLALEGGELHGSQRKRGGRWVVNADCIQPYLDHRPCEHASARRANVTPIRGRAA